MESYLEWLECIEHMRDEIVASLDQNGVGKNISILGEVW